MSDVVYHGSPKKLKKLEPRNTHGDPGIGKRVFASPSLVMALAYMGREWSDRDINQSGYSKPGEIPQQWILQEMRPNAFEEIFGNKSGYLYYLPKSEFKKEPTKGGDFEVTADKVVVPLKTEKINNVLEKLKQTEGLELREYSPESESHASIITRMRKRMLQMTEDNRKQYLHWIKEKNPELHDKLQEINCGQRP